jgi:hypothetical protein
MRKLLSALSGLARFAPSATEAQAGAGVGTDVSPTCLSIRAPDGALAPEPAVASGPEPEPVAEAASVADVLKHRTLMINQQHLMLLDRVDYLRQVYEVVTRDGRQSELDEIWPAVNAFEAQVNEIVERLETMTLRSFELHPRTAFGWFQKRLRRLRAEHKKLEAMSKRICFFPGSAKNTHLLWQFSSSDDISFWDVPFFSNKGGKRNNVSITSYRVEKLMREMRLAGSLGQTVVESMNDILELNVPAIVNAQSCVYAAVVVDVARTLESLVRQIQDRDTAPYQD